MALLDYIINFFTANSEIVIYFIICILLFLGGLGLPIPEDPVLIAAGYVAFEGYTNMYATIPVAVFGALFGDLTVYLIGRYFGEGFIKLRLVKPFFSKKRLVKIRDYFSRHGDKTIFFARFVVGLRNPVYLVAGTMKVSISRFLVVDSFGAFISVPIFVGLGFFFGEHIKVLLLFINRVRYSILFLLIIACLVFIVCKKMRSKRKNNTNAS